MLRATAKHAGERGQVVPIAALMFVVLLGASAIAIDLSMQTGTRRTLQNVTDTGALTGARDLPSGPTSAVNDALAAVGANLSLPSGWEGATPVQPCGVGGECAAITYTTGDLKYKVQVNTPPLLTSNSNLKDSNHIEVVVQRSSSTFVAGALGFGSATEGASSVAFHGGPKIPFGFALYSQTFELGGNQSESVAGNVYAGQFINPQSHGLANFCVGLDSNSNGTIFLGAPQFPTSSTNVQYTLKNNGADPDTVHQVANCSSATGGTVDQIASLGCPASVSGLSGFTFTSDPKTHACIISPAVSPPIETQPITGPFFGPLQGTGSGNNGPALKPLGTLPSGVYIIQHNPSCNNNCFDVDFDGALASGTYNVTFWLKGGATLGIRGGANITINPYIPLNPVGNDGRFIIYSDAFPTNDPAAVNLVDLASSATFGTQGTGPGGCTGALTGTIYLPTGSVSDSSNGALFINGQAIVKSWDVSSGNHPNPALSYSGCNLGGEQESVELVQ